MKTKSGEQITTKEFFSRWKKGMQEVTPMQQTKISLIGNVFVLIGIVFGITMMIINQVWWLLVILTGSFLLAGMGTLGNLQRYFALQKINELMKGGIEDEEQKRTS